MLKYILDPGSELETVGAICTGQASTHSCTHVLHTRPALQIWGTIGTWWSTTSQCCFCCSWRASTSCRPSCGGYWSCTSSRSCTPTSSGCLWRRQVSPFCLQARPNQVSRPAGAPGRSDLRSPTERGWGRDGRWLTDVVVHHMPTHRGYVWIPHSLRAPLRCVLSQERFLKLQVGPRTPWVSSQKPVHLCSFLLWCYLTSPGCTLVCVQNVYLNTHDRFLYIRAQPTFAQLRGTNQSSCLKTSRFLDVVPCDIFLSAFPILCSQVSLFNYVFLISWAFILPYAKLHHLPSVSAPSGHVWSSSVRCCTSCRPSSLRTSLWTVDWWALETGVSLPGLQGREAEPGVPTSPSTRHQAFISSVS